VKETDKHLALSSGVADADFMDKPLGLTNETDGNEVKVEGSKVWVINFLKENPKIEYGAI